MNGVCVCVERERGGEGIEWYDNMGIGSLHAVS